MNNIRQIAVQFVDAESFPRQNKNTLHLVDAVAHRVARLAFHLSLLALPLSLFTLSGCGPFWVDPYITVKQSSLNWMLIHYYKLPTQTGSVGITPVRRISVEIRGNGMVQVKKGTSELVSNDFAKNYKSDNWDKVRIFTVHITPEQANDIFQHLVNFGVLDREKTFKKAKTKYDKNGKKVPIDRFIAVKANLSSNTYSDNVNMFEEDPDLADQLLDVVREFENPTLR